MDLKIIDNKITVTANTLEESKKLLDLFYNKPYNKIEKEVKKISIPKGKNKKAPRNYYCTLCLKEKGESESYNFKGLNPHLRWKHGIGGIGSAIAHSIPIKTANNLSKFNKNNIGNNVITKFKNII